MTSEPLPGFVLFPSKNADDQPTLVPCFVQSEHVKLAELPDVLLQTNRRTPTNPEV
jgi:hypothetical protein